MLMGWNGLNLLHSEEEVKLENIVVTLVKI